MKDADLLLPIFNEITFLFKEINASIFLTRINENAIRKWVDWKKAENIVQRQKPNGGYNWAELRSKYYHKKPYYYAPMRRIDLAIWCEEQLCGLMLGGISQQYDYITIDFIEGSPVLNHPLKDHVLDIILETIERYAIILNINEIRLIDPVENLISYYKLIGFELVTEKQKSYCFRKVHK